ncbi:hypothetical protein Galf_2572 [Gallionella capsiferriformans ES-2]|uniref:Uncharacterized protein n=2 Tax=Gallionella TaxID=96 RepID=D9SCJ0_GALCS|nr:hypothetical protein Galf_2572 [Gallionella capsiferriformans ES-2]
MNFYVTYGFRDDKYYFEVGEDKLLAISTSPTSDEVSTHAYFKEILVNKFGQPTKSDSSYVDKVSKTFSKWEDKDGNEVILKLRDPIDGTAYADLVFYTKYGFERQEAKRIQESEVSQKKLNELEARKAAAASNM